MSAIIDAVYQDGVFRPATPPDLPDGTAVRLSVVQAVPDSPPREPAKVLARILVSAAKFNHATDNPAVTSENVDEVLYGSPDGVR